MRLHYRCSDKNNCGARKLLTKPIDSYVRRPKCPSCGEDRLKIDPSVDRWNKKQGLCRCDGYPWDGPHRKGSAPWCVHSKTEPTTEDYEDRYGDRYGGVPK